MLRERLRGAATLPSRGREPAPPVPPVGRLAWFSQPTPPVRWTAAAIAAALLVIGGLLVRATGGVQYSTVHVMYVPVIIAALVFGASGGFVTAVVAGLVVGPWMPLDTTTGEGQDLANWVQRMCFFCLVGVLVGVGATVLRRQMRYLTWLTDHDPRTGLLTLAGLTGALQRSLASGEGTPVVLVVQLNNLLDIQNTFGTRFGDDVLQEICSRGRRLVPAEFPMALIQPDRLAVMAPSPEAADELRHVVDRRIREPYDVDQVRVYVDFTYGAATFPTHADTAEELVQKASIAMHLAMKRTLPWLLYESRADETSRENLVLLGMVPAAIAADELCVWHQAKTALADGTVAGTEALLRWNHPERGLVMPARFMPQVEASPMIDDVTWWVLDSALADQAAWTRRGHPITVSVNVSVRNLRNRSIRRIVDQAVARHEVPPSGVDLEITESAVMDNFEHCVELIGQFRDGGYSVSIDDFGTGHSSLAYLKELPVTKLKIDQAFIRNLARDRRDQQIVRSIIDLAAALDLETVAEGVEDEETVDLLRAWGCTYAQGNALHVACPLEEFITWIERPDRRPVVGASGPT